MDKIKTDRVIIVEGKYDKIRLSNIVDATILTTDGFSVFNDSEKAALIKKLAATRGLIILTDPDPAGFMIRGHLKGLAKDADIINVYVPAVNGKEKRKSAPSKSGLLGVEGLTDELIRDAFIRSGVTSEPKKGEPITKNDLYFAGLLGTPDCKVRREALCGKLGLPEKITSSAFLDVLNALMSREEFITEVE